MATRCCSPPDRRSGNVCARSSRPTDSNNSPAWRRAARGCCAVQLEERQHDVLHDRQRGDEVKNWKMNPILRRRKSVRWFSPSAVRFWPSSQMEPLSARSIPLMRLSSVLLPLPLLPRMATNSPCAEGDAQVAQHATCVWPFLIIFRQMLQSDKVAFSTKNTKGTKVWFLASFVERFHRCHLFVTLSLAASNVVSSLSASCQPRAPAFSWA